MLITKEKCKELFGFVKTRLDKEVKMGSNAYSRVTLVYGDTIPIPDVPIEVVIDSYCYRIFENSDGTNKRHYAQWKKIIEICCSNTNTASVKRIYRSNVTQAIWKIIPDRCFKTHGERTYILPTDIIHSIDAALKLGVTGDGNYVEKLKATKELYINLDNKTFYISDTDKDYGRLKDYRHILDAMLNPKPIDEDIFVECAFFYNDGEGEEFIRVLIEEYEGITKPPKDVLEELLEVYATSTIKDRMKDD